VSDPEVQGRIEHIADLIARGAYVRRVTVRKLSAEWGLKKSTVEHYAAEARRLVNLDPTEVEQIRDDQLAKLDMIVVAALAKKEYRTAVAAIETASRIAGTQATQRHEIVGSLLVSPLWLEVRAKILRALEPFPEARDAVVAALTDTPRALPRTPPVASEATS
jgi:hypothetical protein